MSPRPGEWAELLDWKRRVFALYARIRTNPGPADAWRDWRETRDELFRNHPQSPVPPGERENVTLPYFDYDRRARVLAEVSPAEDAHYEIATSGDGTYAFTRVATASFTLDATEQQLELYWLDGYGGGLFVPFRDGTAGTETYGAGRYLFDTIKGPDLGMQGDRIVFDFNFAFNPSCAYDPRWVCPLAPPPNRLDIAIAAGERYPPA
jgi:uncharacterized protein (DUF1684 family)